MAKNEINISSESFNIQKWPLSIDSCKIKKIGLGIYIVDGKRKYGMNGPSKQGETHDLNDIWLDNPDIPGTKVSLSPLFRMCKNMGLS